MFFRVYFVVYVLFHGPVITTRIKNMFYWPSILIFFLSTSTDRFQSDYFYVQYIFHSILFDFIEKYAMKRSIHKLWNEICRRARAREGMMLMDYMNVFNVHAYSIDSSTDKLFSLNVSARSIYEMHTNLIHLSHLGCLHFGK